MTRLTSHFTVSLDGLSTVRTDTKYTNSGTFPPPYEFLGSKSGFTRENILVMGSPWYFRQGTVIYTEQTLDDENNYTPGGFSYNSNYGQDFMPDPYGYGARNGSGESVNEERLVYYYEHRVSDDGPGYPSGAIYSVVDPPIKSEALDLPYWGLPIRENNDNTVGGFITQGSSLSTNNTGTIVIATILGIGEYLNYGETVLLVWVIDGTSGFAPPMRQRQRDDGLAISTKQQRGSGSSLQSSLRRGGKVYY